MKLNPHRTPVASRVYRPTAVEGHYRRLREEEIRRVGDDFVLVLRRGTGAGSSWNGWELSLRPIRPCEVN